MVSKSKFSGGLNANAKFLYAIYDMWTDLEALILH